MILLFSIIGIVTGLGLVAVAVWFGLYPSIANRKSSLPEPSGNSNEPNSTNIHSNCRDGKHVIQSSH
ncbi:hypothetical protein [Rhizobium straminoryzae]|uniref:Uncharacterized protein n=1 Tax=Rhizobium straminoryzae TaxID=1387186 RepID=A0A549T767_9HYPH|nr:hypothetical protein [Rhizobium straminoryzae]TRL37715.1 hypothetical protein FNA46_14740 [Rhizobium straminoryzae]